jgi:hypothetical protein
MGGGLFGGGFCGLNAYFGGKERKLDLSEGGPAPSSGRRRILVFDRTVSAGSL